MGKTFHINHLFNLNLPMNQYNNEFGLSSVVPEMKISDSSIVAIDYSGQGLFDEVKDGFNDYKELYEVESFSLNTTVAIECFSLSDKGFIKRIQETIQNMGKHGSKRVIVVHNYKYIESAELALSTFEKYVVEILTARKQKEGYCVSQFKDVDFPIYHLIIGRENCPSGRKYNRQAYNTLKNLIASMKVGAYERQFEKELLDAMNKNKNNNDSN
jgi:hypothetical protein